MAKKLTKREIEEQELADKINPLLKERIELELRKAGGVSLDKSYIISDRVNDIESELSQLKTPKSNP